MLIFLSVRSSWDICILLLHAMRLLLILMFWRSWGLVRVISLLILGKMGILEYCRKGQVEWLWRNWVRQVELRDSLGEKCLFSKEGSSVLSYGWLIINYHCWVLSLKQLYPRSRAQVCQWCWKMSWDWRYLLVRNC